MAGIGFELRRLGRQETLSSLASAFGHAAIVAAGPWLFTILSLAIITFTVEQIVGLDTLATFRIIIIYAFATSLVITSPVTIVATRLVADALWLKKTDAVRPLLIGAFGLSVVLVAPCAALLVFYFNVPSGVALVLTAMSLTVALIWVALSFCGAVRDYVAVTLAFLFGLIVSLVLSIGAALYGLGPTGMAWGFLVGLVLILFGLTQRVLMTFPAPVADIRDGFAAMIDGMGRYRLLAFGALAGTAAVWIDKWVFWFSLQGEKVDAGLIHAPLYDSAMFIASLVIIPSLAQFVMRLETEFFDRYHTYFGTIKSHGTIRQIEAARVRMKSFTLDHLVLITVSHVGICAVLILAAPAIVDLLNLHYRQIAILRFGALGSVFQFIFIATTAMLLFFDRRKLFLTLQLTFFALNLVLSMWSVSAGEEYYGVGYFMACLISSLIAYVMADRTFTNLNYLTFIGNNPSVREAASSVSAQRRSIPRIFREAVIAVMPRRRRS